MKEVCGKGYQEKPHVNLGKELQFYLSMHHLVAHLKVNTKTKYKLFKFILVPKEKIRFANVFNNIKNTLVI